MAAPILKAFGKQRRSWIEQNCGAKKTTEFKREEMRRKVGEKRIKEQCF
jgi:hypothetical protein